MGRKVGPTVLGVNHGIAIFRYLGSEYGAVPGIGYLS
jgi:hypothetical protein